MFISRLSEHAFLDDKHFVSLHTEHYTITSDMNF